MVEIGKIALRRTEKSDYPIIVVLQSSPAFKKFMPVAYSNKLEATKDDEKIQKWIKRIRERERGGEIFFLIDLVLSDLKETIGYCNLTNSIPIFRKKQLNMNILLADKYQGKGYGPQAVKLLLDVAFGRKDLEQITTSAFLENERSIKMLRKIGFKEVFKSRKKIFFAISKDEWAANDI